MARWILGCVRKSLRDDEDLVIERQTWYLNYLNKEISFEHLKKKAPFIALEAERQDLIQ